MYMFTLVYIDFVAELACGDTVERFYRRCPMESALPTDKPFCIWSNYPAGNDDGTPIGKLRPRGVAGRVGVDEHLGASHTCRVRGPDVTLD